MNQIELKMLQFLLRKAVETNYFTEKEQTTLSQAYSAVDSVLHHIPASQ